MLQVYDSNPTHWYSDGIIDPIKQISQITEHLSFSLDLVLLCFVLF